MRAKRTRHSAMALPRLHRISGISLPGHDNRRDLETLPAAVQAQQCGMLQLLPMAVQDASRVPGRIYAGPTALRRSELARERAVRRCRPWPAKLESGAMQAYRGRSPLLRTRRAQCAPCRSGYIRDGFRGQGPLVQGNAVPCGSRASSLLRRAHSTPIRSWLWLLRTSSETSLQRGYFSPQAKNRMSGARPLVTLGGAAIRRLPM
jgi:hypothetical protein